jgi:hypothetical protein
MSKIRDLDQKGNQCFEQQKGSSKLMLNRSLKKRHILFPIASIVVDKDCRVPRRDIPKMKTRI